ncbi:MAG: ABC transporter ATP-binding protein [Oscillospiraceae bacterium]|nr:ABC transporter ATP-binding protein [Oscillospiraceae bacterium]
MSKNSISIKHVSKVYRIFDNPTDRFWEAISGGKCSKGRNHYALDDINIEVREGEILGIIGVNGSGKSTLLKIITGVLAPTSGSVEVNGKISALLELGAGFNPEYTGVENIYFNGMVMGFSKEEMENKVKSIIEFADIGDFINQPVRTYSSGMYVRLAYAVAVSIEPDILIVDEALAVGDAYFQMKSMSKMQELFRKGKTVLFVSHDTASIKNLCTTAIYLDKGRIIARGPATEIVDLYESNVRENMSATGQGIKADQVNIISSNNFNKASRQKFRVDQLYLQRTAAGREGNGKARVCSLQLLDTNGEEVSEVIPFESYTLRMCIEVLEDCQMCIGYHIRDSKNVPVLGSNTVMENLGEVQGKVGECLIVDFHTKLPLRDGRYNIMTVLSKTIFFNRTVDFIELTKDGFYFDVLEAHPVRIWNTVQLPNTISIERVKD